MHKSQKPIDKFERWDVDGLSPTSFSLNNYTSLLQLSYDRWLNCPSIVSPLYSRPFTPSAVCYRFNTQFEYDFQALGQNYNKFGNTKHNIDCYSIKCHSTRSFGINIIRWFINRTITRLRDITRDNHTQIDVQFYQNNLI